MKLIKKGVSLVLNFCWHVNMYKTIFVGICQCIDPYYIRYSLKMNIDHFMACIKKSIIFVSYYLVIRILISELWIASIITYLHTISKQIAFLQVIR